MDSRTENTDRFNLDFAMKEANYLVNKGRPLTAEQGCVVSLSAEVQRLRAKLNTIAFPRRGSPEAGWGVDEIGRFAADGMEPSPAGVSKDAPTVRQASPAELRAAYNSGAADYSQLSGVLISDYVGKLLEAESRRRYPDAAGDESETRETCKYCGDPIRRFGAFWIHSRPSATCGEHPRPVED